MNKRSRYLIAAFAALAFAMAGWWLTRPLPVLTVTTWPGEYGRAQANAMFHPYGETYRTRVRVAEYDGGLQHVRHEVLTHSYDWDVVDFELADAVAACHAGLLAPIDASTLPVGLDGTPARTDFIAKATGPCWVGSVAFAQVIAYAAGRFGSAPPHVLDDFFDLRRFPGPRGLHRASGKLNLELALLADGVSARAVYQTLATRAGVLRALSRLSSIRRAVVWWTTTDEPLQMLADGRARMTTALNGSVSDAQIHQQPVGVVWDRALYEFDVFAIPQGDPRTDRAMNFIRFATGSAPLARVADWVPYGPARRSSLALVGKNPDRGTAMRAYLPTYQANFRTAFAVDDEWWREHAGAIEPLWQAWLAQGN